MKKYNEQAVDIFSALKISIKQMTPEKAKEAVKKVQKLIDDTPNFSAPSRKFMEAVGDQL
jgi:hypothetical protein